MSKLSIILIIAGIVFSALAQIGLKIVSKHLMIHWGVLLGFAACLASYGISFVIYTFLLKSNNLSKISPIMTVGVVSIVVLAGLMMGEKVTDRQMLGFLFSLMALWFLSA